MRERSSGIFREFVKAENTGEGRGLRVPIYDCQMPIYRKTENEERVPSSGNWQWPIANRRSESADDGLAAGFLDLGLGRFRELCRRDLQGARDLAVAKDLDAGLTATDQAGRSQRLRVYIG